MITSWQRATPRASQHAVLVRIDLDTGERVVIADDPRRRPVESGHRAGWIRGGVCFARSYSTAREGATNKPVAA